MKIDRPVAVCLRMPFYAVFGTIVALSGLSQIARAEGDLSPVAPALLLKEKPNNGAKDSVAVNSLDLRQEAGLRCELLRRFGKLLPAGISPDDQRSLLELVRKGDVTLEAGDAEFLKTLPNADDLVYDGEKYLGANLKYIDAIIGQTGRPIAFDRELPCALLPLNPDMEKEQIKKRGDFQGDTDQSKLRMAAEQTFGSGMGLQMVADGLFLRAYAGRFDDLYFHLYQNGNGASGLAFCALADGLVNRIYRPIAGLEHAGPETVKGADLSDILSGGAKTAVRRHQDPQAGGGEDPFKGFAYRVFPTVAARPDALATGAKLVATRDDILRAARSRQHFYPTRVRPLYNSPDRFLGWAGSSLYLRVANGRSSSVLPPAGAVDSWYPLPEQAAPGKADKQTDSTASNQLFESSSAPNLVWEDPQQSNLLADPDAKAPPPRSPAPPSNGPAPTANSGGGDGKSPPASTPPPNDVRFQPKAARLIAVIGPTIAEAQEFQTALGASDEEIRKIEQTRGRLRLMRGWLGSLQDSKPDAPTGETARAIATDLAAFDQRDTELMGELKTALQARGKLRTELEHRIVRERVQPLQSAMDKPPEPAPAGPPKPGL